MFRARNGAGPDIHDPISYRVAVFAEMPGFATELKLPGVVNLHTLPLISM